MQRLLGWVWRDFRFAFHSLGRDKRFTLLAVLALAWHRLGHCNFQCRLRRTYRYLPLRSLRPHGELLHG